MIVWILLLFFNLNAAELNEVCVTPNGEQAKCIPINSCHVIRQAIAYLNPEAIEFAQASQCGYENGPLVCCGSSGRKTTPSPSSTTTPSAQSVPQPEENFSLSPLDDQQLPDGTLCGIQIKQRDNRIVGGNISDIYDFPWMAALKYRKPDGSDAGFRCGGTLISSRFVLTAAQCLNIRGYDLAEVRLGEWQISSSADCVPDTESAMVCADPVIDLKIVSQIPHPFFSLRSGNNDIALLKLEKKVKFTDFIRPICLPPPELPIPKEGAMMDIAGWGITENGKQSDYKLKVQVPVLANEKCKKIYTDYTHINPNQACAGGELGRDACDGDSGGPLMTIFEKKDLFDEDQWYQEGIIYRGLGCGRRGVPSLYTRISRYSKWIVNTIHSNM
ncbi:phenoloxidase-activating factor 1-like [Photinus pyralis]|uniref:CLIP domain-containing serine protease n=1 Tax=Photinus pyralis TaxID=7054 RepID=A0A1Y1LJ46_PHOPY|nr:phenoloxidase-activating factor 1-like [Photinus pyralis]